MCLSWICTLSNLFKIVTPDLVNILLTCPSGEILYKPQKSQKSVTPNPNEWQIDHIIPKTKGGSNSYANAQVLSRFENRMKSDYYSGGD